jgi:hypothetical protein
MGSASGGQPIETSPRPLTYDPDDALDFIKRAARRAPTRKDRTWVR